MRKILIAAFAAAAIVTMAGPIDRAAAMSPAALGAAAVNASPIQEVRWHHRYWGPHAYWGFPFPFFYVRPPWIHFYARPWPGPWFRPWWGWHYRHWRHR
jgi:hypothetical protein